MPQRPPKTRISIDFDLDGPFARHHLLGIMCWRDADVRGRRLAKIGIDTLDVVEDEIVPFLTDVVNAIRYHGVRPPEEALPMILEECARDPAHHKRLTDFMEAVALPEKLGFGLEARFWGRMILESKKNNPAESLVVSIWASLINPGGGKRAVADGPAFDDIRNEISACIRGNAMFSGLSFYLAAAMDIHHKDMRASFDLTYRIIEAMFPNARLGFESASRLLPRWHGVASLWAGFLAEANCWERATLLNLDGFEQVFFEVLDSTGRRNRAISYAAWFADYFLNHESQMRRREDSLVRFPTTVQPLDPKIAPLSGSALSARHFKK